ncbi:hypothetical protein HAX54_036687 [Datura stramonium]|uniref:Uncharacterized protein n=1 Tax=Datura stramonium TaxID=4076 RepID=A0ABS8VHC9_DATST|nr:hypothetical protein [Datura stramonium]
MLGTTLDELMYGESTNAKSGERRHWNLSHVPACSSSETDFCAVTNGEVLGDGLLGPRAFKLCKYFGTEDMVLHQDLQLTTVESTYAQNSFSCSGEYGQQSFRLPPSSPYDKFLKAAGC